MCVSYKKKNLCFTDRPKENVPDSYVAGQQQKKIISNQVYSEKTKMKYSTAIVGEHQPSDIPAEALLSPKTSVRELSLLNLPLLNQFTKDKMYCFLIFPYTYASIMVL